MFEDTIFDNTKSVTQTSTFQYITILGPINFQTETTLLIYERIFGIIG